MVVTLSHPNGMVLPTHMKNIAQFLEVITTLIHDKKSSRLVRHPFVDDKLKEAWNAINSMETSSPINNNYA